MALHWEIDHAREKWYDRVEVLDINHGMLAEGKKRFKLTMYHNSECPSSASFYTNRAWIPAGIFWGKEGNAPKLDLPSDTYDPYESGLGIRNCPSVPDVLKEAYRVIKPGETFACLEFSRVHNRMLSTCDAQLSLPVRSTSPRSLDYVLLGDDGVLKL